MPGYRRNASALINGELLIDPGPCVPDALEQFGIPMGQIKYILNTHRHKDHYNAQTRELLEQSGARFVEPPDGETLRVGDLEITALCGNHAIRVQHFLISDGTRSLFYGLDAAWLMHAEFCALRAARPDLAVLDGTLGFIEGDHRSFEHNNLEMVVQQKHSLAPHVGRFFISHLSRKLHLAHEWVVEQLRPFGIEVAYDGLEIEI